MTPLQYGKVVARGWWLVLLGVLLGALVGSLTTDDVAPSYTSSASILLSPTQVASATSSEAYTANLLAQGRVQSYADLADNDAVTERVIEDLDLDLTPAELASQVTATATTATTVLNLSVTDEDPEQAQVIAQGVADRLVTLITRVERRRADGTALVRAEIESAPQLPTDSASTPPEWRNPALGAAGGLVLGLAAAVVAGRLDRRLRDDDEVVEALGAPVIGAVPPPRRGRRRTTHADEVLSSVRALRTAVFFHHPGPGRSLGVAVTSPREIPDLAQVTVALATSLVGTGHRVLLVEADLQHPRVAELLELDADKTTGLAPHLEGSQDQAEVVHHHAASGLDVIPAGRASEDSADLLHSHAFGRMLTDAATRYDFVLVTTPPTDAGTDAAAVAAQCDTTLVAVARRRTKAPELRATAVQLERVGAEVVGAVVVG